MANQMTPDELREAADRLAVISPNLKPDSLDATVIAAARCLADVIELHRPSDADAVTGDCAEETCDHEAACPTQVFRVCIECWNVAEASDPYFGERGIAPVLWPCDTARIARGETNERESNDQ